MPLRIALTGAQGTGKSYLTNFLHGLISEKLVDEADQYPTVSPWLQVTTLGSATRHVHKHYSLDINKDSSDWTQLYSAVQRRFWEFDHVKDLVVLSERCGLDEVYYQRSRIERLTKETQTGIVLVNGQQDQRKVADLNNANATLQVLLQHAATEINEYWDFVYFMRPYSGAKLEVDSARSGDKSYQDEIDFIAGQFVELLIPLIPGKIFVPPVEFKQAKEYFEKEEWPKWETHLKTG